MISIDAMGKTCPIPVIMTKKAIKNNENNENILVKVDNEIATQNLSKMAEQLGINVYINKISDSEYTVLFYIAECEDCKIIDDPLSVMEEKNSNEYAVVVNSNTMGDGNQELGKKLLEAFVYSLTEQDVLPKFFICYNSAVDLTTVNEKTINDLKTLEENGCEVLSCGLCLDFYGFKDKLQVGSATNMYRITEIMRTKFVVRP